MAVYHICLHIDPNVENIILWCVLLQLEHLGIEGAVHLVGFSNGSETALKFTTVYPDRVRSLVCGASGWWPNTKFFENGQYMYCVRGLVKYNIIYCVITTHARMHADTVMHSHSESIAYDNMYLYTPHIPSGRSF